MGDGSVGGIFHGDAFAAGEVAGDGVVGGFGGEFGKGFEKGFVIFHLGGIGGIAMGSGELARFGIGLVGGVGFGVGAFADVCDEEFGHYKPFVKRTPPPLDFIDREAGG